jgi:hypothetical protein
MKLFLDLKNRRFVKSAASNVALDRLVLKRRDTLPIEVVYVENGAVATPPAGTTAAVGLKAKFSDSNFLAFAAPGQTTLDLNTLPVEAAFSSNPATVSALLEIKWGAPGTAHRTATLAAELQNAVITGDEGTPAAIPDGKASQAEAEAGTDNDKWMTPLRTAQAIAELAPPPTWQSVTGKPETFAPAPHQHTIADTTGLQQELDSKQPAGNYAASAHQHDAAEITSGTLDPARLPVLPSTIQIVALGTISTLTQAEQDQITVGAVVTTSDGGRWIYRDGNKTLEASYVKLSDVTPEWAAIANKPSLFPPTPHTHTASEVTAYNTTIADSVVSVAIGGAPATPASTWKTRSLVQVLDTILFPTVLASVQTAKSINLAVSGASGVLEIGASIARTLTATFTRGTILNGNGTVNSNPLVGAATSYTFTGTGTTSLTQAGSTRSFTAAVVAGVNNWAVTAAHAAGTGSYFDNKGVAGTNLATSRASGTVTDTTSSPTITGVHPYYYLKSSSPISAAAMVTAIQNGTATKVVADSTGTLTIPYAPSAQFLAIAYPSTSTTKTRYFVTALDNGAITVVFAPVATLSVTTALWTQSYKIHTSSGALTNSAANIELRNS